MRKINLGPKLSVPDSPSAMTSPAGPPILEDTSILKQAGMAIYLQRLIICLSCTGLLLPSEAASHWKSSHSDVQIVPEGKKRHTLGNMKELLRLEAERLVKNHGLFSTRAEFYATLPDSSCHPPLPLFETIKGLKCPFCGYVCRTEGTMRAHWKSVDRGGCTMRGSSKKPLLKDIPRPDTQKPWVFNGAGQIFEVNEDFRPNSKIPIADGFKIYQQAETPWVNTPTLGKGIAIRLKDREVHAFLSRLGWLKRLEGVPLLEARALLNLPHKYEKPELHLLTEIAVRYMHLTHRELESMAILHPELLERLESKNG